MNEVQNIPNLPAVWQIITSAIIWTKDQTINDLKQQITGYKIKIEELNGQRRTELEETKKEIEELKEKKDQLEKEVIRLQNEIEELKKELKNKDARMDSLEERIEENKMDHQKQMKEMVESYKSDMRDLEAKNAKRIQELEKGIDGKKKEMEECLEFSSWNDNENQKLKAENKELKNESAQDKKRIRYFETDRDKLCIGQLCMELPTNLYRYVMPEHCCAKYCYYKIKDIENDVDDEDVLMDELERQEARKRLEMLKKKLNWKNLKNLKGAIKLLQDSRNELAHPPVDENEAKRAAQRLNEQGKLKGKISFERVMQIFDMWSVSKSLLGDQNSNYAD